MPGLRFKKRVNPYKLLHMYASIYVGELYTNRLNIITFLVSLKVFDILMHYMDNSQAGNITYSVANHVL